MMTTTVTRRAPPWSPWRPRSDAQAQTLAAPSRPGVVAAIKTVHTLAWASIESCVVYVLHAGFAGRSDKRVGIAAGVVVGESLVFATNGFRCPLTELAERYGAERGSVTDIYLPKGFAQNIPAIHAPLLVLMTYLHARNLRRSHHARAGEAMGTTADLETASPQNRGSGRSADSRPCRGERRVPPSRSGRAGPHRGDSRAVTGRRLRARLLALIVASGAGVYGLWLRPRVLTWGASADEVARDYPGDELIPDPDDWATMATTLPVPPESVWPWLAQMGGDRGGWYSRDWLDNNGKPSADRIVPEWQGLRVGQRLSRVGVPGQEPGAFTVVTLEPNRTLVLRSSYGLFTGRDFDPRSGPAPSPWVDGIWGFHLRPTAGGGTRLVARSRNRGGPHLITRPLAFLLAEPMHFAMQARQFRNLRGRVAAHG